MNLSLGFSSCPNDTFIFEALVNKRIDTEGLEFDLTIADVEELNKNAIHNMLDITKISIAAYLKVAGNYILLNSGGALGENCGPLLISKNDYCLDELKDLKIAVPGLNTTAVLLMQILFPLAGKTVEMIFSGIEQAVLDGKADVGLVIHESRFTYSAKGLRLMGDLGKLWESRTGTPTPLGGIIAKRTLPAEVIRKTDRVIKRSLEYAYAHPGTGWEFIKGHAQETDDEVIKKHIDLYVNHYSLDLGENGRLAIKTLFDKTRETGRIEVLPDNLFT